MLCGDDASPADSQESKEEDEQQEEIVDFDKAMFKDPIVGPSVRTDLEPVLHDHCLHLRFSLQHSGSGSA